MYVAVKTISIYLTLFFGAYNLWPAIQKGHLFIQLIGGASLLGIMFLLSLRMTTNWQEGRGNQSHGRERHEDSYQRMPCTFIHNGRSYNTSKAIFLGHFKQLGGDYRNYTYHIDVETREAFRIEWKKVRPRSMPDIVHQTSTKHYSGYDVWYDGANGYQYAIEDVRDKCGGEAATLLEERFASV